jgi:hypothetical protein
LARSATQIHSELERRFGAAILPFPGQDTRAPARGFSTGIGPLDRLLPGGVPRGTTTVWTGEATSGRTAAVRALVFSALRETLVGLIDATLTLDPADWCGPDGRSPPGLWVARPPSVEQSLAAAWVAEQMLRAGTFGLVVLDGPLPGPTEGQRLRDCARGTGAALLLSSAETRPDWRPDCLLEFSRPPVCAGGGLRVGGRYRRRSVMRIVRAALSGSAMREVELIHNPRSVITYETTPDRRQASVTDRRSGRG